MSDPSPQTAHDRLRAAIADARRGHRITEYEDVALRLARATEKVLDELERLQGIITGIAEGDGSTCQIGNALIVKCDDYGQVTSPVPLAQPEEPADDVEAMAYWARQVVENDGALTADSSMSLDMAHDELTKAARSYLGTPVQTRDQVLAGMQAEVISWAITKGWHGPDATLPTFGEAMALLHSEVSEALEAFREHGVEDFTAHAGAFDTSNGSMYPSREPLPKPEGVGSEFADILIRLLHYSELFGVDLAAEYLRKMTYNHTRAFRHGGRAL